MLLRKTQRIKKRHHTSNKGSRYFATFYVTTYWLFLIIPVYRTEFISSHNA